MLKKLPGVSKKAGRGFQPWTLNLPSVAEDTAALDGFPWWVIFQTPLTSDGSLSLTHSLALSASPIGQKKILVTRYWGAGESQRDQCTMLVKLGFEISQLNLYSYKKKHKKKLSLKYFVVSEPRSWLAHSLTLPRRSTRSSPALSPPQNSSLLSACHKKSRQVQGSPLACSVRG